MRIFPSTTPISQKSLQLNNVLKKENFSINELLKASSYVGAYVTKLDEIEESIKKEAELEEILIAAHEVYQSEIMDQIIQEELEREEQIKTFRHSVGSPYTGSLLPQKYTLKLDGSIIDRREGQELSEKLGAKALEIGKDLLKQHPTGGRLRLSADGTVVGYQDEEWVVIGTIDLQNWFDT